MQFDPMWLLAAFGGGIFGAAIGGLPSFILCGVAAIVGAAVALATGNGNVSTWVAWGPVLGPQISFAGGAAAAVYAARKGKLPSGGRDIATALLGLKSPDVLLVGGAFGVLGYILWLAFAQLPGLGSAASMGFTNPIALSIIVNAIIARLMFGKTGVFGKVPAGENRWRASDKGAWLPWLNDPSELLIMGLGIGIMVSWITTKFPGMAAMWFGFAALSLIFLQYGNKMPVWHHIALAAEQAVAFGGDVWWGLTFAVLGAFIGDFYGQLFTAWGDSHIDPPSASLFTTFTIMMFVKAGGLFGLTGVASPVITVVVALICYGVATAMKGRKAAQTVAAAQ
jgi:hypothetical protein